ncbi:hypothetical protein SAMN02745945_01332 [Peptoclostridium litorale DSM 5388]|uniref:Uncharacterized protein n=1 Tax=Peptoclostridium litorale DSM 5388 TaxID=1121324 RepID=A0A069RCV3_PEPLI|nr:hypothetical protein [Peptoclostridium litorale]KDR94889.1 hypothetical protein CLIT_13c02110 [Peptoclostridium litorale DSM 5388]SIN94947.1 hypothetical protein SAMN02745945_01332 [Peptoclostridium litorale DSM 5388]
MKASELVTVLDGLIKKIDETGLLPQKNKNQFLGELTSIKTEYENVEVPEDLKEVYTSLYKKGRELQKLFKSDENAKELVDKIKYYIRYLKAARADFKGESSYIGKYFRVFVITSVLFLALSPQYFGFVLAAVMFVPIFMGIKGIRKRSYHGFIMSLAVIPVGIMTAAYWLKYGIYVMNNYQEAIQSIMQSTGRGAGFSQMLATVPPILGIVLFAAAFMQGFRAYKSKDLFV